MVLMVGGGEERVYLVYKPGAGEEEGEGRRSTGIVFVDGVWVKRQSMYQELCLLTGCWVKSRSMYQERLSTRFGNIVVYANESK